MDEGQRAVGPLASRLKRPKASWMPRASLVHHHVTHHIKACYLKRYMGKGLLSSLRSRNLSRMYGCVRPVENGVMLWMGLGGEVELEYRLNEVLTRRTG